MSELRQTLSRLETLAHRRIECLCLDAKAGKERTLAGDIKDSCSFMSLGKQQHARSFMGLVFALKCHAAKREPSS